MSGDEGSIFESSKQGTPVKFRDGPAAVTDGSLKLAPILLSI